MTHDPDPALRTRSADAAPFPIVERRKRTPPESSGKTSQRARHSEGAFTGIKAMSISSVHDTLTSQRHSKDFTYARSEYLRSRVVVISLIFLALMPLWIGVDLLLLPQASLTHTMPGRLVMVVGLLITLLIARRSRTSVLLARLSSGLLIGLPAGFYALVLTTLLQSGEHSLIGYSFIPYMLTTMLSVFPFTLIESAIAGITLLVLQLFAQQVSGTWMTAAGLQETWLLAALLVITLTANYFHLVLLLRLYRETTHDPLTGLLNRGALIHNLEQISHMRPQYKLSLLMIDLDHFKRINDDHGHSIGDLVLREFAQTLRRSVRKEDFVARYGGEEFVVVLLNATKDNALLVAEKVRKQAENMRIRNHAGQPVPFTVSIGVASFLDSDTFESVARRADDRLYEAKKTSRNCVVGG